MTVWQHSRKGRIEGEVLWEHGEWVRIRLTGHDQKLYWFAEANRGRIDAVGDEITVRRSFLREVQ